MVGNCKSDFILGAARGVYGAKFGIREHSQGQALFRRDFAASGKIITENLVLCSLDDALEMRR